MQKIPLDKNTLKKFSITMFLALCIVGTVLLLKQKGIFIWFYLLGALFFLSGVFIPNLLKPLYIFWMHFAFMLNYINTRLILTLVFYAIFAPIGMIMRLLGRDLLDRKIEKEKSSYWIKKEDIVFKPLNYERRF